MNRGRWTKAICVRALRDVYRLAAKRLRARLRGEAAYWHRYWVTGPVYIGITGTAGKSTTKELLVGILSTRGGCAKRPGTGNEHRDVELAVLRTSSKHRFSVIELSAGKPGYLERSLRAVRPTIGILTSIGREHYSAFKSLDAIAAEKGEARRGASPERNRRAQSGRSFHPLDRRAVPPFDRSDALFPNASSFSMTQIYRWDQFGGEPAEAMAVTRGCGP